MIAALLSSPRRLLTVLAVVLLAVGTAVGSGATFTSSTVNAANAFTSGTLLQTNSRANAAVVSAANLKPGDTKSGDVTITNSGTLAGDFVLSEANATNTFTSGVLRMRIRDAAGTTLYDGDLGQMGDVRLGSFAVGEVRTFRFTLTLSQATPNSDQGRTANADYVWNATPTA